MIIDTSALVAILDQEPEAERITRTLAATPERMLSAANLVEVGIVNRAARERPAQHQTVRVNAALAQMKEFSRTGAKKHMQREQES